MAVGLQVDSASRTTPRLYDRLVLLLYDRVEKFISVMICDIQNSDFSGHSPLSPWYDGTPSFSKIFKFLRHM